MAGQPAAAQPAPPARPAPASQPAKDPEAARSLIAAGAVVLDVRTPDEYARGHVPDAVNLPVDEVPARIAEVDRLVEGDRTRPIVVYCGSGRRAARAATALTAAGFTHVVNGGGFDELREPRAQNEQRR